MHGVGVGGGVHRDGGDAKLLAGTFDAKRDLSPVGDQDLVEHAGKRLALLDDDERLAIFDGLTVVDEDGEHRAGVRGRDLVHGLHRFDDEQRLAGRDAGADLDEGRACPAPASGRRCRPSASGPCRDGDSSSLCRRARPAPRRAGPASDAGSARDADASRFAPRAPTASLMLDLDLGEARLVQQLGKLADQVLVESPFLSGHAGVLSSAITGSVLRIDAARPRRRVRSPRRRGRRSRP